MFNDVAVAVTGATGSFGKRLMATILSRYRPARLIVFSRDELKQSEMMRMFSRKEHSCMRYFLGDVRDPERLYEAFRDVDYVIHAAALKQVPTIEYNPFEAIKTNVLGAQNVIKAAIERRVKRVLALSTDKAANPINLYGATKLCSDKLFVAGNAMSGDIGTRFSVVRYGNVLGSRGSVVPLFLKQRSTNKLSLTDERMTRFTITLQQGVDFVLDSIKRMIGGEVFVPKIPSYRILDVAKAIAPEAEYEFIGIRPGEKLHEVMVPEDESRNTLEFDDHFVIQPMHFWWHGEEELRARGARSCPRDFSYSSETNDQWLGHEALKALVAEFEEYAENSNG